MSVYFIENTQVLLRSHLNSIGATSTIFNLNFSFGLSSQIDRKGEYQLYHKENPELEALYGYDIVNPKPNTIQETLSRYIFMILEKHLENPERNLLDATLELANETRKVIAPMFNNVAISNVINNPSKAVFNDSMFIALIVLTVQVQKFPGILIRIIRNACALMFKEVKKYNDLHHTTWIKAHHDAGFEGNCSAWTVILKYAISGDSRYSSLSKSLLHGKFRTFTHRAGIYLVNKMKYYDPENHVERVISPQLSFGYKGEPIPVTLSRWVNSLKQAGSKNFLEVIASTRDVSMSSHSRLLWWQKDFVSEKTTDIMSNELFEGNKYSKVIMPYILCYQFYNKYKDQLDIASKFTLIGNHDNLCGCYRIHELLKNIDQAIKVYYDVYYEILQSFVILNDEELPAWSKEGLPEKILKYYKLIPGHNEMYTVESLKLIRKDTFAHLASIIGPLFGSIRENKTLRTQIDEVDDFVGNYFSYGSDKSYAEELEDCHSEFVRNLSSIHYDIREYYIDIYYSGYVKLRQEVGKLLTNDSFFKVNNKSYPFKEYLAIACVLFHNGIKNLWLITDINHSGVIQKNILQEIADINSEYVITGLNDVRFK